MLPALETNASQMLYRIHRTSINTIRAPQYAQVPPPPVIDGLLDPCPNPYPPYLGVLVPDVGLTTAVSLLPAAPSPRAKFSLSKNPLHNSAKLSLLPAGLSDPLSAVEGRAVEALGLLKMLLRFIWGLSAALEETRRRKGESGARRDEFGFMGWAEAPGRARPADSFCSA